MKYVQKLLNDPSPSLKGRQRSALVANIKKHVLCKGDLARISPLPERFFF
jgi:hypothetical protein